MDPGRRPIVEVRRQRLLAERGGAHPVSYSEMSMSNSIPLAVHHDELHEYGFATEVPAALPAAAHPNPRIRLDLEDDGQSYALQAEIPGAKKGEILVRIDGNRVSIQAEIRPLRSEEGEAKSLHRERHFGIAFRAIALPRPVDAERAQARFEDGVLYLKLPTQSQGSGRNIEVF